MEKNLKTRLIDINILAESLNLKVQTIRNQLSNGSFPIQPKKVGGALRWDIRDINKFLDNLEPLTNHLDQDK